MMADVFNIHSEHFMERLVDCAYWNYKLWVSQVLYTSETYSNKFQIRQITVNIILFKLDSYYWKTTSKII